MIALGLYILAKGEIYWGVYNMLSMGIIAMVLKR